MSEKLKKRLKELREKRGLKQSELANALGMKLGRLQTYEQGKRDPPIETLIQLADFFNVDTDYLIGRDRERIIGTMEKLAIILNDVPEENRDETLASLEILLRNRFTSN